MIALGGSVSLASAKLTKREGNVRRPQDALFARSA
jgi:hypothetical protein